MEFKAARIVNQLPDHYFAGIYEKVALYKSKGIDVINLASGNPDLPTPHSVVQALKNAVDVKENHGYSPFFGKKQTLEAIALFYKREYGVKLDPDTEIAIFQGSGIGVTGIPQVLLNPGDYLLTTDPAYPAYETAATLAKANFYQIPVYEQDGFLPNYETVPEEIVEKVKLLILNYPNNPTGALATEDFFEKSIAFAAKNQFPVLNDFAYGAFGFDGHKPISLMQIPGGKEYGIETYSASKTYNMAGWRFGFVVGNASIIKSFKHFHSHAYSTIFGAVQDAAVKALLGPQDPVRELCQRYEKRRDFLVQQFRKMGWNVPYTPGTFFAWFRVPEGFTSKTFADFLFDEAHVAVAPGEGFGENGSSYVRVNLLNDEERMLEAVNRMAKTGIFNKATEGSS
ncbi:aminotransferase class I/II-fold pyridoxal phosphate-dependent enzyme [Bacillus sp. FJAT-50079]|uniref:aminotransferase class I/II-fold pyridoxal phosphate-dependent enzyme n=1 Tax=Bacillus sp. FJAT-50079 TaxID=2833577 RepID=UPI001BCA46BB|nr:aminotransferase class I/II-fold pyridoxal phosphate-dependent enzyme [Bacillus sp. FJAT-50079]MBS4207017.1 aminotransferase class I/II-fold pyridoxal phosphate-dependent enzyme [Bacillus sp. FJAT-50079]